MRFIGGWIRGSLLAVAFTIQGAFAAANTNCVPQAEMRVLAKHFTQFQSIANADYCYDGSQTSGLIQSLEFMRDTVYTSAMPKSSDELFSGTFVNDWYGYFTGRINDLQIQSTCPKGVGAFVYSFGHTMYICPMLLTDSFSSVDRISVMMHEARHIDGFPHITCAQGPRAGIGAACDKKMSDLGSYAVTVETYAQLGAYAVDLHPALKAYARASAVIYAQEAFEVPARLDFTPQFLLMTTAKEFYRLPADGSAQLARLGDSPSLGHIVMRAKHMILFPDDKTLPAQYVFARNEGEVTQAAGDLAAEYNSESQQQRADLVDLHVGAQWSARIYHAHAIFLCDPTSAATQDVALPAAPASLIYPTGYNRAAPFAQVVLETGALLELGCESGQAFVRASSLKLDQKYKRVYKSGTQVLGLRGDGRLFKINGSTSSALQTSADGKIYELVPNEDYHFFDSAGA